MKPMGIRHGEFPHESSPHMMLPFWRALCSPSFPHTLQSGIRKDKQMLLQNFRSCEKVLASVTSSAARYTQDWPVLPCKIETGCDISHFSIMCVPLWWAYPSYQSCSGLFQLMGDISSKFLIVKLPLCRTCCIFVVSVFFFFFFNSSKRIFISDLTLILGNPCFQGLFQEKQNFSNSKNFTHLKFSILFELPTMDCQQSWRRGEHKYL